MNTKKGLKISELPELKHLTGDEMMVYQDKCINGKISTDTLKEYVLDLTVIDVENIAVDTVKEFVDDGEDLALVESKSDSDDTNVRLKFADKIYNRSNFSGIGRIYLRKNIVDDKNILIQSMINKSITKYIIQYDYDLNGETIVIPGNCILDFKNGGNFSNGTLDCNNTTIRIDNFDSLKASLTGTYTVVDALNEDKSPYMNDTAYNAEEHSGLGHVYLRKNKGVLTQDKLTKSNTIYHIRYDYDLQGEEITIPDNCVLKFEGGSLSNGSIIGSNTDIISSKYNIFINIVINGIWKVIDCYSDWFDFSQNENIDNLHNFRNLFNLTNDNITSNIYISDGIYYTRAWTDNTGYCVTVKSNTNIYNNATIKVLGFDDDNVRMKLFSFKNVHNCTISGGKLIGNIRNYVVENGDNEHNFGIHLEGAENIIISNIIIEEFYGDGIDVQSLYSDYENHTIIGYCKNIYIDNVKSLNNGRQGLSIEGCIGIHITNSEFNGTGSIKGTNNGPWKGIDIEPWFSWQPVSDIFIDNCIAKNNKGGSIAIFNNKIENIKNNTTISNSFLSNISLTNAENVLIYNCALDRKFSKNINTGYISFFKDCSNITINNCTLTGEIYSVEANVSNLIVCNCNFNIENGVLYSGYTFAFSGENTYAKFENNKIIDRRDDVFGIINRSLCNIEFINNNFTYNKITDNINLTTGNWIGNVINVLKFFNTTINCINNSNQTRIISDNTIYIPNYVQNVFSFLDDSPIGGDTTDYIFKNNKVVASKDFYNLFYVENDCTLNMEFYNNNFPNSIYEKVPDKINILKNIYDESINRKVKTFYLSELGNLTTGKCECIIFPKKVRYCGTITIQTNSAQDYNYNISSRFFENFNDNLILYNPKTIEEINYIGIYPEFATDNTGDDIKLYIKPISDLVIKYLVKIELTAETFLSYSPKYFYTDIPTELKFDSGKFLNDDGTLFNKVTII